MIPTPTKYLFPKSILLEVLTPVIYTNENHTPRHALEIIVVQKAKLRGQGLEVEGKVR